MSKLLLLIFAVIVLIVLVKGYGRRAGMPRGESKAANEPETMVSCAHCGVHLPVGEAIDAGGRHFCSEGHRRLGAR